MSSLGENEKGINSFCSFKKNNNLQFTPNNNLDPYDKIYFDLEENHQPFDDEFMANSLNSNLPKSHSNMAPNFA